MKLKGPSALLFSNNEEQETSTETKVKPRRGLGCGREAQGSGGARGTLCAWHVSFSAPPPRRAGRRSPLSAQEQRKGVSGAGGLSVAPSALCRRLCWGGGRKAVALPAPVSLLQTAWLCNSCSGLCGGGGRSCCWTLLVNPR